MVIVWCSTTYTTAVRRTVQAVVKEIWKYWRWGLRAQGRCSCKILFWALPIHLSRHLCCSMYRLATMHSITDGRTNRRRDNMPIG